MHMARARHGHDERCHAECETRSSSVLCLQLSDPHCDLDAPAIDCPRLHMHLAKAPEVSVRVRLRDSMKSAIEPPPLTLNNALQRPQFLKGVRHGARRFSCRLVKSYSLFVLCLTHPLAQLRNRPRRATWSTAKAS